MSWNAAMRSLDDYQGASREWPAPRLVGRPRQRSRRATRGQSVRPCFGRQRAQRVTTGPKRGLPGGGLNDRSCWAALGIAAASSSQPARTHASYLAARALLRSRSISARPTNPNSSAMTKTGAAFVTGITSIAPKYNRRSRAIRRPTARSSAPSHGESGRLLRLPRR